MPGPYVVLDYYVPKLRKAWKVGRDLTRLTESLGLIPHDDPVHGPLTKVPWYSELLHAEVRKRTFNTKKAEDWHYDGDTTPGSKPDCCLVLWTDKNPTEIKDKQGKIWQPEPFQVIIFRNKNVLHRRPLSVPKDRWVFRQRVEIPNLPLLQVP